MGSELKSGAIVLALALSVGSAQGEPGPTVLYLQSENACSISECFN
jgi:hypothetical protein